MFGDIIQKVVKIIEQTAGNQDLGGLADLLVMSPLLNYTINKMKETVCSVHTENELSLMYTTAMIDHNL